MFMALNYFITKIHFVINLMIFIILISFIYN